MTIKSSVTIKSKQHSVATCYDSSDDTKMTKIPVSSKLLHEFRWATFFSCSFSPWNLYLSIIFPMITATTTKVEKKVQVHRADDWWLEGLYTAAGNRRRDEMLTFLTCHVEGIIIGIILYFFHTLIPPLKEWWKSSLVDRLYLSYDCHVCYKILSIGCPRSCLVCLLHL